MKLHIYKGICSFFLLAVSLSSCQDFLEFEPYGLEGSVNFWKTENDVQKALNAFHEFTYKEGVTGRGLMWFENCSDNIVTGRPQAEADQIKNFQMSAGNGRDAKETWPAMFQLNAKANDVLRNVPGMAISEEMKNKAIGQAHFYRAFAYLWLAPFYGDNGPNGGIPIITENTPTAELDQPRPSSVLANYDMIIQDMEEAGNLLPYFSQLPSEDYGRPHKAAAWAFAARAALYAAQYDAKYYNTVIDYCDRIINLTGEDKRGLYPDFSRLFRQENNFCEEYVFSLLGNAIEGPKFHGMSFQNGGWGLYNTWGYFQPTLELYKAYEKGDVRRDATILYPGNHITFVGEDIHFGVNPSGISSTSGMTFRKFISSWESRNSIGNTVNPNSNNSSNVLGMVLIRYADVLLMKAEALIWSQGEGNTEAKALLNRIRKRAGLPENSQATKAQLKNERRCELAFEFQPSRHIDLVRWGDAQQAYSKPLHGIKVTLRTDGTGIDHIDEIEIWASRTFNPKVHHVFPIPSTEISRSKNLTQNKGY
ncbi:RagB/SusD family nutrient uptake outer membrane protein [Phocaeicola faecicola]|uniref:RagB/SusD family nutrient uptake outer membrane protein n=1 Tax=Phocaeicola faecicola TaxID=2739389 RepID=UPI0015E78B55|nr:RagB/SusD family nutrient uptake outer membrane protein [Phocaeicola faecicola]